MKKLNLCIHAGGERVDRDELKRVATPDATDTWCPIPHHELVSGVEQTLGSTGLRVIAQDHAVAREGNRYFGMMQLANGDNSDDYGLVIGLRNSHDKRFPAGLVVGSGVFVCDNLAFSGEIRLARKHTKRINDDLPRLITTAVGKIADHRQAQDRRIAAYHEHEMGDTEAHDLIIQAFDAGAVTTTRIPEILKEWRAPRHPEFAEEKNGWRLFNAFTETMKGTEPNRLMRKTLALHGLMDAACGLVTQTA